MVEYIKIDGSFIRALTTNSIDQTIVGIINEMAHRLGIQTIAEYVETPQILELIAKMNIDYAQGIQIGKPKPLEDL